MSSANDLEKLIRERLPHARQLARQRGVGVLEALCDLTGQSAEAIAAYSRQSLSVAVMTASGLAVHLPDFRTLPFAEAVASRVFPFIDNGQRYLVVTDPWDHKLVSMLAERFGGLPELVWASAADIIWALNHAADSLKATQSLHVARSAGPVHEDKRAAISLESIERTPNAVVRFVDSIIYDGWKSAASDIHVETLRTGISVKFRLDGVLVETARFDDVIRIEEVLNRIKVLAQLDISERRIPQDGRFRVVLGEREVDFRVSVMPSIFGEDAVIRLLDKSQLHQDKAGISLDSLGFSNSLKGAIRGLAEEPHGMLLVTGPTGSGKTTTLYAVISEIRTGLEKFVTIEDPVEYELAGVLQIPVNEKKGLTFSKGLRSILRHDPDKILVGEIRDSETAEIAVQAALTGHGVFTTVHANNPFDVVGRFLHMGIDLFSFSAALNGIVSQRLVRRVCDACAESVPLSDRFCGIANEFAHEHADVKVKRGRGCDACRFTGYKGRFAIAETVVIDDALRQMIVERRALGAMRAELARRGITTLRQAGIEAVLSGRTTEEEFRRVVAAN